MDPTLRTNDPKSEGSTNASVQRPEGPTIEEAAREAANQIIRHLGLNHGNALAEVKITAAITSITTAQTSKHAEEVAKLKAERDEAVRAIDKAFMAIGNVGDWISIPREDLLANAITRLKTSRDQLRTEAAQLRAELAKEREKNCNVNGDLGAANANLRSSQRQVATLTAENAELKAQALLAKDKYTDEANLRWQNVHHDFTKALAELTTLRAKVEKQGETLARLALAVKFGDKSTAAEIAVDVLAAAPQQEETK